MIRPSMNVRYQRVRSELITHLLVLSSAVVLLWFIELVDLLFWHGMLDFYGI